MYRFLHIFYVGMEIRAFPSCLAPIRSFQNSFHAIHTIHTNQVLVDSCQCVQATNSIFYKSSCKNKVGELSSRLQCPHVSEFFLQPYPKARVGDIRFNLNT